MKWFDFSAAWIFSRLALQNLGRHKARTLLLILAVAMASGAIFSSITLHWGIQTSMAVGFARLGADLLIVPQGTLVNLTSALLTAEPNDLSLDATIVTQIAALNGIKRLAPQLIYRTLESGYRSPGQADRWVDLVGFDPEQDLTVMPWLVEKLPRPFQSGDVIVGGQRNHKLNQDIYLYGQRLIVYGRLDRTGVGTHERGLFMGFDTLKQLAAASQGLGVVPLPDPVGRYSGLLVELQPDATLQQVQFAILAQVPQIKVIVGGSMLTSVRQGLKALFRGILLLMLGMLLGTALLVSVIFSAIVSERRHELGLLSAIGTQQTQILQLMLLESALTTGLGGVSGVMLGLLLLRLYQRFLVFYLNSLGIAFFLAGARIHHFPRSQLPGLNSCDWSSWGAIPCLESQPPRSF